MTTFASTPSLVANLFDGADEVKGEFGRLEFGAVVGAREKTEPRGTDVAQLVHDAAETRKPVFVTSYSGTTQRRPTRINRWKGYRSSREISSLFSDELRVGRRPLIALDSSKKKSWAGGLVLPFRRDFL